MPKCKAFVDILALVCCALLGALLCGLYVAFDLLRAALLWLPTRLYTSLSARLFNDQK
jgi:hypothetical protein